MLVQIILIAVGFIIALSYPIGIEPLWSLPTNSSNALISAINILLLSILYILVGINLVKKQLHFMSSPPDRTPGRAGLLKHDSKDGCNGDTDAGNVPTPNHSDHTRNHHDYRYPAAKTEHQIQQSLGRYYRRLFNYRLLLLLIYFIQVYIFHLPILIENGPAFGGLDIGEIPFITNLLILLPFLLTLLISHIPFYRMERFMYRIQCLADNNLSETEFPTLTNYLVFQVRTYFLLAILPFLAFILFVDFINMLPVLRNLITIYPFIGLFLFLLLLLGVYMLAPFVLKYIWVTEPLPEGPLRLVLQSISYRAKIKVKDFLIWKVGHRPFANALLIGLFPFNRFVMFTDTVLKKLSDEEVTAVCAHEIGHAKFNHLLILLVFSCAYMSILFSMNGLMNEILGEGIWNFSFSLLLLVLFWVVLFGQLSRRFELQADWFAGEITANPDSFASALSKIAYLNGIPFKTSGMSSLTHPSIEKRINHIQNKISNSATQLIMMRKVVVILIIFCVIGLSGVSYTIIDQIGSAPKRQLKLDAAELAQKASILIINGKDKMNKGKFEQSISCLNAAIKLDSTRSLYHIMLGDAYAYLEGEQSRSSMLAYKQAYILQPTDPLERYYLSQKLNR
ncbi:MAG: M48 family metalloprotease [Planctomycetota bacterium]